MKRTTDELERQLEEADGLGGRMQVLNAYSDTVSDADDLTEDEREIFEREAKQAKEVLKPALQSFAESYKQMLQLYVQTWNDALSSVQLPDDEDDTDG